MKRTACYFKLSPIHSSNCLTWRNLKACNVTTK